MTVNHLVAGSIPASPANHLDYSSFDIRQKENFFSVYRQKEIYQYIFSNNIKWKYKKNITNDQQNVVDSWEKKFPVKETGAFVSMFDDTESFQVQLKEQIVKNIEKNFNISVNKILRFMFTFYPPNPSYPDNKNLIPHVDVKDYNVMNFLYYVNDNDAPTIFYKELHKLGTLSEPFQHTIYKTVEPKQNRAVLFNGRIYHSANVSKLSNRLTINMILT